MEEELEQQERETVLEEVTSPRADNIPWQFISSLMEAEPQQPNTITQDKEDTDTQNNGPDDNNWAK